MSGLPTTVGPTGISPAFKYVALALLTIVGTFLGQLQGQPVISEATIIAAAIYALPTVISELENA